VNKDTGIEREVAVIRNRQAIHVSNIVKRFDGYDFVIVPVLPVAMIVNTKAAAPNLCTASLAGVNAMRDFR
jgi:hypothetical protein